MAGRARRLIGAVGVLSLALTVGCRDIATRSPAQLEPPPSASSGGTTFLGSPASEANAELELGTRLMAGRGIGIDPVAGAALIERLAGEGNASAQFLIGEYYFSGRGVERKLETAVSWLEKAAAQDLPVAQAELAAIYTQGLGGSKDYGKAFKLATAASTHGVAEGDDILGLIYLNGWGVPADGREAIRWLTKAAGKKDAVAMRHLGEAYRDGKGVPADNVVAAAWFDLAFTNALSPFDKQSAAKSRDDLAALLFPADLALARRLAADWKPGDDLAAKRARAATETNSASADTSQGPGAISITSNAPPVASALHGDVSVLMKSMIYEIDVAPDGSRVTKVHYELQARNEAAVKDVAQIPLTFASTLQKVDIVEAHTLKQDGRKLPVDPSAIYTQLIPNAPNLPLFDDQRQKVVVFPDVEAGDVTVVTARYTAKPAIPGYFGYSPAFDLTVPREDARITITVPKTMPLATETHDLKFEQREAGDKIIYEWRFANLNPLAEPNIALDPLDRWPRLFASNFQSYDQLAKAYAALAEPKIAVTPRIQKLADEITAGTSDRRKQAEVIYNWVSRHIRYVAVEIGTGGFVPHDAEKILANAYGDCKDHTVLFAALLKAKGIASDIVLINFGTSYALSTVPTFGALNHAITWLPEFNLYADTTAGVAPFGTLPFGEYGKPVIHATGSDPVLRRTPNLSPGSASITVKTTAHLSADGRIAGDSESSSSGAFAIAMRQDAIAIQSAGVEQAVRSQLRSKGYEGTGKLEFDSPFEPGPTFRITGHFETSPRTEFLHGTSFYPPLGLIVGAVPGEFLMGELSFRDFRGDEPTPCYGGHEEEELSLELPPGKHVQELPKGTTIANKYLSFKSEWSISGQTVAVRREFSANTAQSVCIGEVRLMAAKALDDIRKDYRASIVLVDN